MSGQFGRSIGAALAIAPVKLDSMSEQQFS